MYSTESIRLTFVFEGQEIALKSAVRLAMRAPQGDRELEKIAGNIVGQWVEVHNEKGAPLYRRLVEPYIPQDIEVHGGDEAGTLQRIKAEQKSGVFHLVVPVVDGGVSAVLVERPAAVKKGEPGELRERMRVDIREVKPFERNEEKGGE